MGWVAAGQLFNVLFNFVIIKQISSIGTEGYGIYALVFTINLLATYLIYGPGMQSFLRFYYTYYDQGRSSVFVTMMFRFISVTGGAIILLGILSVAVKLTGLLSVSVQLLVLGTLFTVANRSSDFFSTSLNMIRKRKENSLFQNSEKLLNIFLLLIIYLMHRMNIEFVLGIFVFTASLFAFSKFLIFRKNAVNVNEAPVGDIVPLKKEIKKTILTYAFPFIIWGLAGWLQSNSEKWIIADYLSTSDVGIYALMMNLVNAFIIIPNTIITDFSTPIIFQSFSDLHNKEKVKKGFLFINIIILIVFTAAALTALLTYFFGAAIIKLISSSAFTPYAYLLPLLCIGIGLFFVGQAMCNVGMALNVPKKYILPKIISGVLAVGLNILFLVKFGIIGVTYSSICLGLFYSVYIWLVNKQILGSLNKV